MEVIGKVSKGSKMDQVYIPKNRVGLGIGSYVVVKLLEEKETITRPYFYNTESIEPIKLEIIAKIFQSINKITKNENIIITGSFLDAGFNFNDIDILLITEEKTKYLFIKKEIEDKIKIKLHLLILDNKTLIKGLSTDPLYQLMLSKCIAKKRLIYNIKPRINYKILDLNLLKSKTLIDNFEILNGNEKYYLIRNMIAISLYIQHKKINKESVEREIKKIFNLKSIKEIKQNMIEKEVFLKKYKATYKNTFNKILQGIKNASE
jgi:hypothetical protein